jgi:IS30 family transposase
MIPPEQRAAIRRLYYAEHWRIGTIATTLGVHHDTVRVTIERLFASSTLDPYKPFVLATLEQYPRLRATRLCAMLRERGFAGSAVQVQVRSRWGS